jgi:hypothetical protein
MNGATSLQQTPYFNCIAGGCGMLISFEVLEALKSHSASSRGRQSHAGVAIASGNP